MISSAVTRMICEAKSCGMIFLASCGRAIGSSLLAHLATRFHEQGFNGDDILVQDP